jgi:hypothetical protein
VTPEEDWDKLKSLSKRHKMRETNLYAPIKAFLNRQGYTVKAEVGKADIVALRGQEDPVIVEMKTGFSLSLFHQCVERQSISDHIYLAVPRGSSKAFQKSLQANKKLARRLGFGLITVRLYDGLVEIHQDPAPYQPRKSTKRKVQLLRAFARLDGDPNTGGATRHGLVTGYRQDAIKCATYLGHAGAEKGALVAKATGVKTATTIMRDNHYGWFLKVETGVYNLTEAGRKGLADWQHALD